MTTTTPMYGLKVCPDCESALTYNGRAKRCRDCTRARERRARAAGSGTRLLLPSVVERDGTDCALCGEPVDLTLKWEPPITRGYATLDHVVPLVHGGRSIMSNLRLAHYICNIARGAARS